MSHSPTQDHLNIVNNTFGTQFELNASGSAGYWDMPFYELGAQAIWVSVGQTGGPISLMNSSQQAIIDQFTNAIYDAHAKGSSTIDLSKYFTEYSLTGKERSLVFAKLTNGKIVHGSLYLRDGGDPIKAVISFAPTPNWGVLPSMPDGPQDRGKDPINGWYQFIITIMTYLPFRDY